MKHYLITHFTGNSGAQTITMYSLDEQESGATAKTAATKQKSVEPALTGMQRSFK